MSKRKKKRTPIQIEEDLKDKLKIIAAKEKSTIKDLVESALREKYDL